MEKEINAIFEGYIKSYFDSEEKEFQLFSQRAYTGFFRDGYVVNVTSPENCDKLIDRKNSRINIPDYGFPKEVNYLIFINYLNFKTKNKYFSCSLAKELIKDIKDVYYFNEANHQREEILFKSLFQHHLYGKDIRNITEPRMSIKDTINLVEYFTGGKNKAVSMIDNIIMDTSFLIKLYNKEDYMKQQSFQFDIIDKISSFVDIHRKHIGDVDITGYFDIEKNSVTIDNNVSGFKEYLHEFMHFVDFNYFDYPERTILEKEIPAIIGTEIITRRFSPVIYGTSFSTDYLFELIKDNNIMEEQVYYEDLKDIAISYIPVIEKAIELLEL